MQVSWIDADEVRDLVALLAEPPARAGAAALDLDSLPEAGGRFGFELLTEKQPSPVAWQPQPVKPVYDPPAPSPIPAVQTPAVQTPSVQTPAVQSAPLPEVSEVREKLRQIRDRAQAAGLLTKENPVQAPAPSPSQPVSFPPVPAPAPTAPPAVQTNLAALGSALASISPVPASLPQSPAMASVPTTAEKDDIAGRLEELAHWAARVTGSAEIFMLDDHGNLLWGIPTSPDILLYAKLVLNASMRAASPARLASATPVQVGPGKELQLVSCPTPHGYATIALVNARQVPTALLREALALAMDR